LFKEPYKPAQATRITANGDLLLGLLVLYMLAAVAAVLLDVQSVRVILFVFHRRVIASFASAASQRDDDSVVFLSQGSNSSTCERSP